MALFRGVLWLLIIAVVSTACARVDVVAESTAGSREAPTVTLPALRSVSATSTLTRAAPSLTPTPPLPTVTPTEEPTSTATAIPHTPTITATAAQLPSETPFSQAAAVTATEVLTPTAVSESPGQSTVTGDSTSVNGVPVDEIVIMPENARENVRRIYRQGQALGRNPRAFSKLGDSVTLTDHFLTRFDSGYYDLGPYAYLQTAVDHYQGSFARYGVATKIGLHAWSIFDPLWADKEWCLPDENIAACEIRLNNPSVLLIKIGSNDSGAGSYFEENFRLLLDYTIENGVIPIIGTKADRFEGPDDRNNRIMRELAAEYAIPLWDYDRVASTLPRRGLSGDDVHMTMADADDYTSPETFTRGYPVSDLTALMTLYEVMREVKAAGDA